MILYIHLVLSSSLFTSIDAIATSLSSLHLKDFIIIAMPSSSSAEENVEGLGGLLKLVGIIPARARFVGEALVSSILGSVTAGLTLGTIGAVFLPTGPLIPFLMGSWMGNTLGLYNHYSMCKNGMLRMARNYPSILAHAMWTEWGIVVPSEVVSVTEERIQSNNGKVDNETAMVSDVQDGVMFMDQWIQKRGSNTIAMAILAAQQCSGDVEEVQRHEMEVLIQSHQEKIE